MAESSFLNPAKVLAATGLHEGMRVADFGAGSGFFTRTAARLVTQSGEVWAVDVHREILSRIKNLSLAEGLPQVEVVHGDLERPQGSHLDEDSFDLVIAANLFFGAQHKEAVIEEIYRVLKRGGRALVVDWQDSFGGLGPHHEHVVSETKMLQLFEAAGFGSPESVPAGAYHWGFVVRKKAK